VLAHDRLDIGPGDVLSAGDDGVVATAFDVQIALPRVG
jgi:hypothetical protein